MGVEEGENRPFHSKKLKDVWIEVPKKRKQSSMHTCKYIVGLFYIEQWW